MDTSSLLQEITAQARDQRVTELELLQAYRKGSKSTVQGIDTHIKFTSVLSYLGGFIILLGITILLGQNWQIFNSSTRILLTLGSGIASYCIGLLFSRNENTNIASIAFYFLSSILMPLGLFVTFYETGYYPDSAGVNTIISAILLGTFLATYTLLRRIIFLFFTIVFGTWLFFAFTSFLLSIGSIDLGWQFYAYRVMLTGASYILLGLSFRKNPTTQFLTGVLYFLGAVGLLGAAFSLGGNGEGQSVIWEILYPGIVVGMMLLSVTLKSRSFLILGALFLMAFLIRITSEYFGDGIGWPLALIFLGFCFIGIGSYTYHIGKKYLSV